MIFYRGLSEIFPVAGLLEKSKNFITIHHSLETVHYARVRKVSVRVTLLSTRQKAVFHFSRIVVKRNVFHCFLNTQAQLMIWTQ